ncbi:TPA: hypothetical protein ACVZ4X_000994 [Campylobacter jejuni]|nr:hypothetical protein [Campylobacter jejuni]
MRLCEVLQASSVPTFEIFYEFFKNLKKKFKGILGVYGALGFCVMKITKIIP